MSSSTQFPIVTRDPVNVAALLTREIHHEFGKLVRRKQFAFATIALPVLLYVVFGASSRSSSPGGVQIARYMLAGTATFGVMGASLFGVGLNLALERSQRWVDLKRASPLPFSVYLLAKAITSAGFGVFTVLLLELIAVTYGGVALTASDALDLVGVGLAGSIVFGALGMFVGIMARPQTAHALINLIHLPMSFLSGLWIPLASLPTWVQNTAPWLPPYHISRLMLHVLGYARKGSPDRDWAELAIVTVLFIVMDLLALRFADI
jgi:ABC-2 type transport system permease protein